MSSDLKTQVAEFWDKGSCGEIYGAGRSERDFYESQAKARYELEPYLLDFARFEEGTGKDVLEIGVGLGADHLEWAKASPRSLTGIDLTPRAIEHTKKRFSLYGRVSDLRVADAEALPFKDESFDLVYSWGVLHHSPETAQSVAEVYRVLRTGGQARVMIYHRYSLVGYMLWARYALLRGRPLRSLDQIYAEHLESPGTKAYSIREARSLFHQFSHVSTRVQLSFGDLLEGSVGQRHGGWPLVLAKRAWPRPLIKRLLKGHGLGLLIEAIK